MLNEDAAKRLETREQKIKQDSRYTLLMMQTDQWRKFKTILMCRLDETVSLIQSVSVHFRMSEIKGHSDQ